MPEGLMIAFLNLCQPSSAGASVIIVCSLLNSCNGEIKTNKHLSNTVLLFSSLLPIGSMTNDLYVGSSFCLHIK